ncbi:MAG: zonular occludens toxin domain-containing protein [Thiobacillus sp.]|nr:zonular occludens toxin domain-containing protein [Thiobacillus sp.]
MPINAYTGLMGSGKTYEVVASVILEAIRCGRNVVSNIHGLNQELIYAYLVKPKEGCEFGKITLVKNEQVESREFFPEFDGEGFAFTEQTIVRGGDVVAIDEAWRPWGTTSKCVAYQMSFFREHRHCVNAKGVSCDLVLITQDITDIHKLLKNVVELSMRFVKLKTLGLSTRYRIEIYEGSKLFKSKITSWTTNKYNKKIFPLYKSFASNTGGGAEVALDKRQNLLMQGSFLIPLVIAAGLMGFAAWYMWGMFHPEPIPTKSTPVVVPAAVSALPPGGSAPAISPAMPINNPPSPDLPTIAGRLTIKGADWVVINTPSGLQILHPSAVYSSGLTAITQDANQSKQAYLSK